MTALTIVDSDILIDAARMFGARRQLDDMTSHTGLASMKYQPRTRQVAGAVSHASAGKHHVRELKSRRLPPAWQAFACR
jgi:hypothetical protein